MSNPNARKGADLERDAVRYLQEVFGRVAFRPHQEGYKDVGDIHLSPFVIQAKNWGNVTSALNEGVKGALEQAVHAGEMYGVALIKKRGAGIALARIAMTLRDFRRIVTRLKRAEEYLLRASPDLFDKHIAETKKENDL